MALTGDSPLWTPDRTMPRHEISHAGHWRGAHASAAQCISQDGTGFQLCRAPEETVDAGFGRSPGPPDADPLGLRSETKPASDRSWSSGGSAPERPGCKIPGAGLIRPLAVQRWPSIIDRPGRVTGQTGLADRHRSKSRSPHRRPKDRCRRRIRRAAACRRNRR